MASLAVYRQLLTNRPLTKLLVGEFISGIGDWLYIVAIFVVIYTQSGDAALVVVITIGVISVMARSAQSHFGRSFDLVADAHEVDQPRLSTSSPIQGQSTLGKREKKRETPQTRTRRTVPGRLRHGIW